MLKKYGVDNIFKNIEHIKNKTIEKHKLVEMGFDENKTAHEITLENNMYRIYDCGTIRFSLKF